MIFVRDYTIPNLTNVTHGDQFEQHHNPIKTLSTPTEMEDDDFDQLLTADDGGHLVPLPVETVTPSPLSRPVGETNVIEPQHAIIDGNLGARLNGASEDMDASTAILSIAPLPQWGSDITALQPSQERKRHARSGAFDLSSLSELI